MLVGQIILNLNHKSQQLLQQQLLSFLYSESSWRYNILPNSNVCHDKDGLKPQPQDIVAMKMAGDSDFKMGVVTGNIRMSAYQSENTDRWQAGRAFDSFVESGPPLSRSALSI